MRFILSLSLQSEFSVRAYVIMYVVSKKAVESIESPEYMT